MHRSSNHTWSSISPLMSALTSPTYSNKREKKKKRKELKKPNKGKEQNHLKKTSHGPLRQGQRLDTSETKQRSSKKHKPPNQSSTDHKELPLHTCKLPLNQFNSPWTNACNHLKKTEHLHQLSPDRSDRSPPSVRLVPNI
jgi:hypothetical protein